MLVVANPGSILSREIPYFMIHYANTLGLNTTWQFFSPNPGGERYLEYEVHLDDGMSDEELVWDEVMGDKDKYHYWPPKPGMGMLRENINRCFYHSLLSTFGEQRIKDVFIPWACRKHPEAYSISIRGKTKALPTIEVAQIENKSFEHLSKSYDFELKEHICPGH